MSTSTGPTSETPTSAQDLSTDEAPASTELSWPASYFPKLGGSITMIFAAILGSLLTSWIARRACPDSWTGQYCESCRTCFTSFRGRTRKKSAIVLPADQDPILRWTVGPGPNPFTTTQEQPSGTSSSEGLKNGGDISIETETKAKPRAKPSFMTISSLVSNFTVPRTDLTSIALEQVNTDKNKKSSKEDANKDTSTETKTSTGNKDGDGQIKMSKESLTEDDSNLANGAIVSKTDKESVGEQEDISSYDENEPLHQTHVKEVTVETHANPLRRYSHDEIIDPREVAKLDSPSQKSETYSSDFESSATHMTLESGLYSESPIRTIYEEVKSQ
ncbi:hypothetical protein HOLleu_13039 [Holothuria leucospilota]|uniref:Uncharacterized protein n=1 Tax=Holothuria leucospilota TaxID=206669 RepID=A0A9Q1CBY8_HOLLE|nr:hypothetical protein HOLleu_13039 [Holothuria leucospilota]